MRGSKISCGELDRYVDLVWNDNHVENEVGKLDIMSKAKICKLTAQLVDLIDQLTLHGKVKALNFVRTELHKISPFETEPVDCVLWVPNSHVFANDYNPNSVAPPEMELLRHSIQMDGYTQPIVGWPQENEFEVIDGFHRHRVGKECEDVRDRVNGYLPIVKIKADREERNDRIASTIRHNRARGKHGVSAMSDIVVELKRRNWSDHRISKELGMEQDEVLRLLQISGLTEMFSDQDFSKAWDIEGFVTPDELEAISEDESTYGEDVLATKTVNTEGRVFHTYDKWECYAAGFYNTTVDGMTKEQCQVAYREFLTNLPEFEKALKHVITHWKNSCEHYLTNNALNRIAWLGQASACHAIKIPSTFRSGFSLLTEDEQADANRMALKYLNKWLVANGHSKVDMPTALAQSRQAVIY